MTSRAVIIAIEDYPDLKEPGIEKTLAGTLDSALAFRQWIEDKWKDEGQQDTEIVFHSEPKQTFGLGASSSDIVGLLNDLGSRGQNSTDELFFFFSGHGYTFVEGDTRADVIIASDFKTARLSNSSCFNLDWIIGWLRSHLGPGRHFYFVDACRNPLDGSQVAPPAEPLPSDPNSTGEPTTFVLQSTITDSVSVVDGPFQKALMAGLSGDGRAKDWERNVDDEMYVRYDTLRRYLSEKLDAEQGIYNKVEGTEGESDGLLAILRPVPTSRCKIDVKNSGPGEGGTILYRRGRAGHDLKETFTELPAELALQPDDYGIAVELDNGAVDPDGHIRVDMFEDRELVFDKVSEPPSGGGGVVFDVKGMLSEKFEAVFEQALGLPKSLGPMSRMPPSRRGIPKRTKRGTAKRLRTVDISLPSGMTADLRHRKTGRMFAIDRSGPVQLVGGRYEATLRDADGSTVSRKTFSVTTGSSQTLDLSNWTNSVPRAAVAKFFPHSEAGVEFSESLGGPIASSDLDLWLAIVGGGRILGGGDRHYSKIAGLPMPEFPEQQADCGSIYVLAGFEDASKEFRVGLSRDEQPEWRQSDLLDELPGIRELYLQAEPGPQLLSFTVEGRPAYTIASLVMKNRSTLVTVTEDAAGRFQIAQYLLPVGTLTDRLDVAVQSRLGDRNPLADVRDLATFHKAFRARRRVLPDVPDGDLWDLLYGKWVDPVGPSLAAYELLRRGNREHMPTVVHNMINYYPDLPDTTALARLAAEDDSALPELEGPPLFLDGLSAFGDVRSMLPLPVSHLDYSGPWTAWRAAVQL